MSLRLYVPGPLVAGADIALPEGASRHAQVRRVQPGDAVHLFDGSSVEAEAEVLAVGRREVRVRVGAPRAVDRELPLAVTLALGMPANERMDALVEKASELGVAVVQPLLTERSVLRLEGERAERKRAHWQAIAVAACEQCGRTRVPMVEPVRTLSAWLAAAGAPHREAARWVLSLAADARPLAQAGPASGAAALTLLSGPEGGLTQEEEAAARAAGFVGVSLGPRVLRADTAPLAALAWCGLAIPRQKTG
jgi:16S rRNA (uracil1498-N3)-methyltransferase